MKIPYFCCIGAELKRYAKDFDFMNQVYLYKVPTDDSIEEVLAEDYFKAISDSVLQDDLVYIYEASAETLHSCRFDKQNGHITAIPLASDETLTGAVTTIIHDNLTKNRAVISNNDGKIAVSEVTSTELGYLTGATSNIQEQLNEKAKTDLSNLTSTGQNIANWSSNVTNCITEIPQDINIVKNNDGSFTLKAGSKLYRPNGVGVFNTYTVPNDITFSPTAFNDTYMYFLKSDGTALNISDTRCFSGATAPTGFYGNYAVWYDTTNNLIKYTQDAGSTWTGDLTLPICLADCTASTSLNTKNIFNGFGYIGATVFALPGVKGLIPNGRNADGTLKNIAFTVSSVKTQTASTVGNNMNMRIYANGSMFWSAAGVTYYDSYTNYNMSGTVKDTACFFGTITTTTDGQITSFTPKQVFHAVDYSDTGFIAHQAMPSDKYIDLSSTTITDGMNLTAPADGYYSLYKASTAAGQMIGFLNSVSGLSVRCYSNDTGETLGVSIPVSKGQTITLRNSTGGNVSYFRFVYANGSK